MLKYRCFLSLCFLWVTSSFAQAQVVVPWGQFDVNPISPVARPLDMLVSPNGFISSDNVHQTLDVLNQGQNNQMAIWSIQPVPSMNANKRWAVLRVALPKEDADAIMGVRLTFQSEKEIELSWRLHTRGTNFYRSKPISRKKLKLNSGKQSVDLLWTNAGIKKLPKITAFELSRHDQVGDLGLIRFDLIFKDQASAKKYQSRNKHRLNKLQKTMRHWLAERGVNLKPLQKVKTADQLEATAWDAVQLLGLAEPINHWGQLTNNQNQQNRLELQRKSLVTQLIAGKDIERKLSAFVQKTNQWIDQCVNEIPTQNRRWSIGKDQRFHRPTGQPFRMYGPHFFRSMHPANKPSRLWRPWDITYLAGMGFNGLRLHIRWCNLEPTQGTFDQAYLNQLKAIMREAERYGMAVSVDMHWPFPDWFIKGKPGMQTTKKYSIHLKHNVYHWPEALIDAWRRLAIEFANSPNILAFEVPANETNVGRGPGGLTDYPNLVHQWNQWLKQTYQSREKLQKTWLGNSVAMQAYRLKSNESWDDNTIAPLGFQTPFPTDVNANYQDNPRLWDHMRFAAAMQKSLTTQIMKVIRQSIPDAVGMSQRTIGDMYDVSPVPMSYYAINTLFGEHVNIGTHYGMGGSTAIEAASLNLASYDSERQMEKAQGTVRRQVELGLGFCPFAFHARGGGGMLFADDDWHMKPQCAYLPGMSDWIRTSWPKQSTAPIIAVISNTRLAAINADTTGDLVAILKQRGWQVKLFEALKIVESPQLLDGCKAVITPSSYMDVDLLAILAKEYVGRVLLYGRLDVDALCRNPKEGLPAQLVKQNILLNKTDFDMLSSDELGQLDMTGSWQWQHLGTMPGKPEKLPVPIDTQGKDWQSVTIPGKWGEMGLLGSSKFFMGDSWCVREVFIPKNWQGRSLIFEAGAMDDYDWTFFNGKLIGKTTKSRHHYWLAPRQYVISEESIKWGQKNTIAVRLRNDFQDGGIWKGPVQISSSQRLLVDWKHSKMQGGKVQLSNHATLLNSEILRSGVKILAILKLPDSPTNLPAMLKDGQWYWWIGSSAWVIDNPLQTNVLDHFLSDIKHKAK